MIDRYRIIRRLGAGGMGVVYEAEDPDLNRRIAIKLLHENRERGSIEAKRLLREARSLAQLNHPNVVEVFGSGVDDGRVWLAMELIEGQTLKEWAAENPPGTEAQMNEALGLLRQAAEGLAAVHALSMTHRDFKPANVLIGDDGRVRVVDFGLAVQRDYAVAQTADVRRRTTKTDSATRSGMVVGTPKYMSPEQQLGRPATAKSDQFAFAVTAWECLHGTRPTDRGEPRWIRALCPAVHPKTSIPRRVTLALRRAMSANPRWRYRNLTTLVASLEHRTHRVATIAFATAAVVGTGFLLLGTANRDSANQAEACTERVAQKFSRVWSPQARARIERALTESGVPFSSTAMASLGRHVEGYRTKLEHTAAETCSGDATVSPCVRRQLQVLAGVLGSMEDISPAEAEKLTARILALPDPRRCVSSEPTASPAASTQESLVEAEVALATREYDQAEKAARAVLESSVEAEATTRIDALIVLGTVGIHRDAPDAIAVLEEAYDLSIEHGSSLAAAVAARELAIMYANRATPDTAKRWINRYEANATRSGYLADYSRHELMCRLHKAQKELTQARIECEQALDDIRHGRVSQTRLPGLSATLAGIYSSIGEVQLGLAMSREAYRSARQKLGPDHPKTAGMLLNLGVASSAAGEHSAAIEAAHNAGKTFMKVYGPGSRWVISSTMNEASYYSEVGDFDTSSRLLEALLPDLDSARPLQQARVLNNLAGLRSYQGRFRDALRLLAEVDTIESTLLPDGHAQRAHTRMAQAWAHCGLGQWSQAIALASDAIQIRERTGQTKLLAGSLHGRTFALRRSGALNAARVDIKRRLRLAETLSVSNSIRLTALLDAALVELDDEQWENARTYLEEAETQLRKIESPPANRIALLRFLRARYAHSTGVHRDEVRNEARQAYAQLEEWRVPSYPPEEAKSWLDSIH